MKALLSKHWELRTPSERVVLLVVALVLCVTLYLWLIQAANRARSQLKVNIPVLKFQSAQLEQQAAEYARLRQVPARAASPADLRVLMQIQADAAGLSRALTRIDAVDANHVQVIFDDVPFANWLAWVANLQAQHVRLGTSRIEASAAPGLVKITATFVRPSLR